MRKLHFLLMLLLLLQSCSVYHSESLTPEAAVAARNKLKVITADKQKYTFKRLEMEGNHLTGISGRNSAAAKELPATSYENKNKLVQVDLSDVAIEEINLRNNTLSTLLSINVIAPIAVASVSLITLFVAVIPMY